MTNQPSHPDFEMVPVGSYDFLQLDKVTFGPGTSKDLSDEIGRLNCSLPFFITSGPAGTRLIDDAGFAPSGKVELGTAPWPDGHGVRQLDRNVQSFRDPEPRDTGRAPQREH